MLRTGPTDHRPLPRIPLAIALLLAGGVRAAAAECAV